MVKLLPDGSLTVGLLCVVVGLEIAQLVWLGIQPQAHQYRTGRPSRVVDVVLPIACALFMLVYIAQRSYVCALLIPVAYALHYSYRRLQRHEASRAVIVPRATDAHSDS